MDRIEAMVAFVAVVDGGGFSAAARKLRRSPASITRAVALLESRLGFALLVRTTRAVRSTEAGERYLAACRRILAELAAAETLDADERAAPRGLLGITAPIAFGRQHVRPIVDVFLTRYPEVQARLLLVDRLVGLVDEGLDVAIRIAHLPDSSLVATTVGEVRTVVCASPAYLKRQGEPTEPAALSRHTTISFSDAIGSDLWTFGGERPRQVRVKPRLTVNNADAAVASAVEGNGVTRVLSYQVADELRRGRLVRLLEAFEPPPVPVHVVSRPASTANPKVRAFVDLVVPGLRSALR